MSLMQWEFLIQGNFLSSTIESFWFSDRLFIEKVIDPRAFDVTRYGQYQDSVFAYLGSEQKNGDYIECLSYMDFLLLLYAVVTNNPCSRISGVGINLEKYADLGKRRVSFPSFEKLTVLGAPFKQDLEKLSSFKSFFNELVRDRAMILNGFHGIALQSYYDALKASEQNRFDHSIIHLFVAAESLLVTNSNKIRNQLANRVASLLSNSDKEKEKIGHEIKKLYGTRSGIVHGGGKKATAIEARALFQFTQKAILGSLKLRHLTKIEFVETLDQI